MQSEHLAGTCAGASTARDRSTHTRTCAQTLQLRPLMCVPDAAAQGGKEPAKAKAQRAAKQVKKSTWKKQRKPRFSVVFHRPKTLKHARDPKYPRIRCVLARSRGLSHALPALLYLCDCLCQATISASLQQCMPFWPAKQKAIMQGVI